jgi:hypothetical protein
MNTQQLNDAIALHIGRLMIENTVLKGQLDAAQARAAAAEEKLAALEPKKEDADVEPA